MLSLLVYAKVKILHSAVRLSCIDNVQVFYFVLLFVWHRSVVELLCKNKTDLANKSKKKKDEFVNSKERKIVIAMEK